MIPRISETVSRRSASRRAAPSSRLHGVLMYLALKRARVPAELHIYATAAHDFGVRKSDHPYSTWTTACEHWLRYQGYLGAAPKP